MDVEPAPAKVGKTRVGDVQHSSQCTDDAAVADDETSATTAMFGNVDEALVHALDYCFVAFESIRFLKRLHVARPPRFDLWTSEALPRSDVGFLNSFIHDDGSDAQMFGNDLCSVTRPIQL